MGWLNVLRFLSMPRRQPVTPAAAYERVAQARDEIGDLLPREGEKPAGEKVTKLEASLWFAYGSLSIVLEQISDIAKRKDGG